MKYMVPYSILRDELGNGDLQLTEDQAISLIRKLLRVVPVNEKWYCEKYPDVAEAISDGRVKSAKIHFITNGYREGRIPFEHEIDEEWYERRYPDVAQGVEAGNVNSPREHYTSHGYKEGRLPGDIEV